MSESKVTELTAATSWTTDDLLYIVDSPASSPVSKKITCENLFENVASEIVLTDTAAGIYFGPAATDGSWRIIRSGNNLVRQRRESGSWVTKATDSA